MNEKLERAKTHIQKYRSLYISGCVSIVSAGITVVIMRGRHAGLKTKPDENLLLKQVIVRPFNFLSSNRNTVVDNAVIVIEREGRGHPGYIVRCLETGEVFSSQKQAATTLDIPASVITDHLNGKFNHANGYHLERLGVL